MYVYIASFLDEQIHKNLTLNVSINYAHHYFNMNEIVYSVQVVI